MNALIDRSRVSTTFERLGYRTVNIGSWWDVDRVRPAAPTRTCRSSRTTSSSYVFWRTTMWPTLARLHAAIAEPTRFNSDIWRAHPEAVRRGRGGGRRPAPHVHLRAFPGAAPAVRLPRGRTTMPSDCRDSRPTRRTSNRWSSRTRRSWSSWMRSWPAPPPATSRSSSSRPTRDPIRRASSLDGDHYDFFEATQADLERKQMILSALYLPGQEDDDPGASSRR